MSPSGGVVLDPDTALGVISSCVTNSGKLGRKGHLFPQRIHPAWQEASALIYGMHFAKTVTVIRNGPSLSLPRVILLKYVSSE